MCLIPSNIVDTVLRLKARLSALVNKIDSQFSDTEALRAVSHDVYPTVADDPKVRS